MSVWDPSANSQKMKICHNDFTAAMMPTLYAAAVDGIRLKKVTSWPLWNENQGTKSATVYRISIIIKWENAAIKAEFELRESTKCDLFESKAEAFTQWCEFLWSVLRCSVAVWASVHCRCGWSFTLQCHFTTGWAKYLKQCSNWVTVLMANKQMDKVIVMTLNWSRAGTVRFHRQNFFIFCNWVMREWCQKSLWAPFRF